MLFGIPFGTYLAVGSALIAVGRIIVELIPPVPMTGTVHPSGGSIPFTAMRRVDHYVREHILMPNGSMMCRYTPVFTEDER